MHPHQQLIEKFYSCFQARDSAGMSACYHAEVVFSDPVFGRLQGPRATAMWRMLCARAKDLEISFGNVRANQSTGAARWEARYTWGKSGRPVHNVIEAAFVFREGLIVEHVDTFSLWRWARMALGPAGLFLGWSPAMQEAIRKEARHGLDIFIQKGTARNDPMA